MHFVTGGAYNGKARWVKSYYKEQGFEPNIWISAYQGDDLRLFSMSEPANLAVIEGMELYIKELSKGKELDECRKQWKDTLMSWAKWELSSEDHRLVLIGTDISKGIVPLEREHRVWRDLTGWVFQDAASICHRVDLIWYGINKTLKNRRDFL
ncbi:bifunctional adenosylcobinamide kinase/adenosylcobinamide-phosphate guanylyltransferase [Peribacillus sp. SCS-155]|uniref:bifunctional adenosylcobinamide kinase/adenosylcobinamide-phosphate guanylyltransferase n=1 Tax=Peribacillus sedimenti TaxID=3115297 RepID=UPI003906039D